MTTKIEICSNALVRIGSPPISSFTEGGAAGIASSNLYEPTLRAVLTSHRWRFATAKRSLARLTSVPINEWSYAFQLPSDLLLMFRVYPNTDYEIYENKIYTNQTSVDIDYISRVNESLFPGYFQLALEYKLASEFALIVTNNRSLNEVYESKAMQEMRRARFADSQGRPSDPVEAFDYINVRG